MNLNNLFLGNIQFELVSADVPGVLSAINDSGAALHHVQQLNYLTVQAEISRSDWRILQQIAKKRGAKVTVLSSHGAYRVAQRILKRPVLLAGFFLLLMATLYLPSRVLFVRVEGNQAVPDRLITDAAAHCGIQFGANRRAVRSETIKNQLLGLLPQLKWAGINTKGCTAVISVVERELPQEPKHTEAISSIVAARDGIIYTCTATQGNMLCKPGQAVKAGETLISGYTDCGLSISATRAEGEILAQTMHELTVSAPLNYSEQAEILAVKKKYSLIIGKKRINFYKGSGILGASCDKMYHKHSLTLPGGFVLPVSLQVEYQIYYDEPAAQTTHYTNTNFLQNYALDYLKQQMIAGTVLTENWKEANDGDVLHLEGSFICLEMIGQVKNEEIIK